MPLKIEKEPDKAIYDLVIYGKKVRFVYNTKENRFVTALSPTR